MNQYGSRKASELTYEQKLFIELDHNPMATRAELSEAMGTNLKTVAEYVSKLKKQEALDVVSIVVPAGKKIKFILE